MTQRLKDASLGDIAKEIQDCYPHTGDMVFHKDANPNNWIVANQDITAIDWEDHGLMYQHFDLVKLIEQSHTHDDKDRERIIKQYMRSYGVKDKHEFTRAYQNAVIPTAISFALHSYDRGFGTDDERAFFLDNAARAAGKLHRPHLVQSLERVKQLTTS